MSTALRPEFRELPIHLIDEPVLPSRSSMDEQKLEELIQSIRANGFISVVVVVRVGDRFRVVAGHRRTIAARRAPVAVLPCFVYPSEADALDAIQHAENRHREELSVGDEAIWFAQLLEKYPEHGTDGVAGRVGETRAYVEGRLALLMGDELIFQALQAGAIKIGVAHELNKVTDQIHRRYLLDLAMRQGGVTVAIACGWVAEWRTVHEPALRNAIAAGDVVPTKPIADEPFKCEICGLSENTPRFRTLWVHDYCVPAVLAPALEHFRRRGELVPFPRTLEQAIDLINRVTEQFPQLIEEPAPRA